MARVGNGDPGDRNLREAEHAGRAQINLYF